MSFIHSSKSMALGSLSAKSTNARVTATCADPFAITNLCGGFTFSCDVLQFSLLQAYIVHATGRLANIVHTATNLCYMKYGICYVTQTLLVAAC